MDMESISSVNSNYSSTESVKVKSAPVESAQVCMVKSIDITDCVEVFRHF